MEPVLVRVYQPSLSMDVEMETQPMLCSEPELFLRSLQFQIWQWIQSNVFTAG